jgi:hypothetical protein
LLGGRRWAGDEGRATRGGRQAAGDKRRATSGGRQTAGDMGRERRMAVLEGAVGAAPATEGCSSASNCFCRLSSTALNDETIQLVRAWRGGVAKASDRPSPNRLSRSTDNFFASLPRLPAILPSFTTPVVARSSPQELAFYGQ